MQVPMLQHKCFSVKILSVKKLYKIFHGYLPFLYLPHILMSYIKNYLRLRKLNALARYLVILTTRSFWYTATQHAYYSIYLLTLYQTSNFRLVQIESICRRQNKCNLKTEILFVKGRKHLFGMGRKHLFGIGRKHSGKRRKCW